MTKLTFNPRNIESPTPKVADFYADLHDYWKGFNRVAEYTYDDGRTGKPCLDLTCGNKRWSMEYQHVFLFLEALKAEPEFLNEFMEWVHQKDVTTIEPQRTSRIGKFSRRRSTNNNSVMAKPTAEMLYKAANLEFDSDERL